MIDLQEVIIRFREGTLDRTVTLTKFSTRNVTDEADRIAWRISSVTGYSSGPNENIPDEVMECLLAVFAIQQ